jgi:N6-adenosine-specific RNA methylase IME4
MDEKIKLTDQDNNSGRVASYGFGARKRYDIITADPPWEQGKGGQKNVRLNSSGGDLEYPTVNFADIKNLLQRAFGEYGTENLNVFVWTIDKYLTETDLMLEGFGYRRHARLIWDKVTGIPAAFTIRYAHEYLLWYYKGKFQPIAEEYRGKFTTVFREQVKRHSQKPECVFEFLSKIYPDKTKLELFARPYSELFEKREGWDVWGNEVTSDINLVPQYP